MKKLMIAAAAAAMVGGAFADAQVYEYKLSLTSTTCKEGTAAKNSYWTKVLGYAKGDEISYRNKTSFTLNGLTWGCTCNEALAGQWDLTCLNPNNWFGITFWEKKADAFLGGVYDGAVFDWDDGFINRIGKKCAEVEMSVQLVPGDNADPEQPFAFRLAGMGTIEDDLEYDDEDEEYLDCESVIKSAKGSVAGWITPDVGISVCKYCEEYDVPCDAYVFCVDACCDHNIFTTDADKTVAYGTWTMKYNAGASKKLKKTAKITESYTGFSKNVKAALAAANE